MILTHEPGGLVLQAPAKINLHLEILGKRGDGYHEIESLMLTVSLWDTLRIGASSRGTRVVCSEERIAPESNLVTRAVELVRAESGRTDGVIIQLEKRIPLEAGLAGGSTDAAACLAGLNHWWKLKWPIERLMELGARLGSDVPFFFQAPAAVCRGRGELVTPCPLGKQLHLVLVCPNEGLETKAVYAKLAVPTQPQSVEPIAGALGAGDERLLGRLLFNRLEEPAVALSAAVGRLAAESRNWECLGARMSGSGTAWFALCDSKEGAHKLASQLAGTPERIFVVQSSH